MLLNAGYCIDEKVLKEPGDIDIDYVLVKETNNQLHIKNKNKYLTQSVSDPEDSR
jgi:hypothetical protein